MAYYPLKIKDGSGNLHTVGDPRTSSKADSASPSLTGTPTAPTAATGTDTTQIATTAFVNAEINNDRPFEATATNIKVNGTQAVGTQNTVARGDHVHPTDTSRAPVASPTFTGTPAAPTAAVDTNTTQIATTAYVVGQGYAKLASPTFTGTPAAPTASAGTNTTQIATTAYVRGEVSALVASAPSTLDTLNELATALGNDANFSTTVTNALAAKAPLASPTLTGTPAAPTAAADTNTTQIATTAFVLGQASSTTPAMDSTAAVGTSLKYARADHVHASDTTKANLASPTFTGTPAAPTAAAGTNTTQIATTAYVRAELTYETTTDLTVSANATNMDVAVGNVGFVASGPTANWTLNFTNLPTTNGQTITATVFVTQGATGYIPATVQIAGVGQTIKWQGGSAPTPTSGAGKIDAFSFSMIRRGGAWTVLGSMLGNF